jgi:hypothetical protein
LSFPNPEIYKVTNPESVNYASWLASNNFLLAVDNVLNSSGPISFPLKRIIFVSFSAYSIRSFTSFSLFTILFLAEYTNNGCVS